MKLTTIERGAVFFFALTALFALCVLIPMVKALGQAPANPNLEVQLVWTDGERITGATVALVDSKGNAVTVQGEQVIGNQVMRRPYAFPVSAGNYTLHVTAPAGDDPAIDCTIPLPLALGGISVTALEGRIVVNGRGKNAGRSGTYYVGVNGTF